MNNEKYILAFDVGGTKIEGVLCSLESSDKSITIKSQKKIITPTNSHEFFIAIKNLIDELVQESLVNSKQIQVLSLGLPGSLHPKTKVMMNGNTQFLLGVDIQSELEKIVQEVLHRSLPIFLENDANCFILAEAWAGCGLQFQKKFQVDSKDQVAVGITLGTGVGGGLLSNGSILSGAIGAGMEVGHISLNPRSHLVCYCGQKACAELFLSGSALNKIMDSKELFVRAENNDPEALRILKDYRENMLHFLSIIINLMNPHYIVFGGGLSSQSFLFLNLKEQLKDKLFLKEKGLPEIYISKLPLNAGVYGAVINAYNQIN